jgi:hypothetical protein
LKRGDHFRGFGIRNEETNGFERVLSFTVIGFEVIEVVGGEEETFDGCGKMVAKIEKVQIDLIGADGEEMADRRSSRITDNDRGEFFLAPETRVKNALFSSSKKGGRRPFSFKLLLRNVIEESSFEKILDFISGLGGGGDEFELGIGKHPVFIS